MMRSTESAGKGGTTGMVSVTWETACFDIKIIDRQFSQYLIIIVFLFKRGEGKTFE